MSGNGRITILLIGSSADEAHALRQLIAASGGPYAFEHAGELEIGFTRLSQGNVHVALLDLSVPKSQGLETFLRARRHAVDLPIVVLADPADERLAVDAVQKGAQDYLIKGKVDLTMLLHAVRSAMERQQLMAQIERSTRQLQASELNFQHIIESNADGMVVVDRQGTIQFVNPAAESLLARPIQELIGKPFEVPLAIGKAGEFEVVSGGQVVRTVEVRVVDTIWEGQSAFLASLRDISERKRLERLKDEFVGKVSHELRTPLTSIKGTVTLMLNRALGPISAEQQDFLQTVSQDIDRLAELINNLLDLSKIEAGKMVVTRKRLDLSGLIEQVCRSYHTILGGRRVVRALSPVPPVYADRNLIVQVISNLVGNAVKFTPDNGTITFTLQSLGDRVALTVSDNGPGIPKESLGKLFQKFVQADGSSENHPKGTGLGLAICREIIDLHQGEISVDSEVGHGTAFTFTLPVYDPAKEFDQLFESMKASTEASDGQISLLVLDVAEVKELMAHVPGRSAEHLLGELEKTVRASVSRADHVLLVEPTLLAVLAAANQQGAESMRQRLNECCAHWLQQVLGSPGARIRLVSATYPAEGELATVLLRQAKAKLRVSGGGEALTTTEDATR